MSKIFVGLSLLKSSFADNMASILVIACFCCYVSISLLVASVSEVTTVLLHSLGIVCLLWIPLSSFLILCLIVSLMASVSGC